MIHLNVCVCVRALIFKVLQDKKLKGQLAVREKLYGQSAKAAAKAEKVPSFLVDSLYLNAEICCRIFVRCLISIPF